jgi:hypothetical protein
MFVRTAAFALVFGASPALAFDTSKLGQGGSLPLADLMPVIAKSAQLQREVNQALTDANKNKDSVICSGMRFPGQWANLGGFRVSPYTCNFGTKWLQIKATVRITGAKGRVFETITPSAMKNATEFTETNLRWTWTTDDPTEDK